MELTVGLAVATFVAILGTLIVLRLRRNDFEIKPTEVVVAILPIIIFLIVTGKVQKFEVGGLKFETVFAEASAAAITGQVTKLPFEQLATASKGPSSDIQRLLAMKVPAISFRIGETGYVGSVIQEYFGTLTKQPFLRHVVIENADGTFFAIADARALAEIFRGPDAPFSADEFAAWLESKNIESFKRLPGVIFADSAVSPTAEKKVALQRMEVQNLEILPVLDEEKRFLGVVNRSRLLASLILDVSNAATK